MNKHNCPNCQTELQVLLFMGVQPDGFVCPKCKIVFPIVDNEPDNNPNQWHYTICEGINE